MNPSMDCKQNLEDEQDVQMSVSDDDEINSEDQHPNASLNTNSSTNPTLKSTITVECARMNKSKFHGTINYTEAKEKIFIVNQ